MKTKKLLAVLLAVMMILSTFPMLVFAESEGYYTYSEGYYTYTVSEGGATIIEVDTSISGDVTIPSTLDGYPVTTINDCAFYSNKNINSVTIPDSVTSIGGSAFYDCTNLSSVTIPDSVTNIGYDAFFDTAYYNDSLNWEDDVLYIGNHLICADWNISGNHSIKNGTKCIADKAFISCVDLTEIIIPDGVISIGESAFEGCSKLVSVTIPDGVISIGESAFEGCSKLVSVTIPDGVISIGDWAFYNCTNLSSVTIPDSVTNIAYGAFIDTAYYVNQSNWEDDVLYIGNILIETGTSLSGNYSIKNGTKCIAGEAFGGLENLTGVTIPNSVTSIGDWAFEGCTNLTDVTIPNSVMYIGKDAFSDCTNLTDVTLSSSLTSIAENLFKNCTKLATITIPNSVIYIGKDAFSGCSSLQSITLPFVGGSRKSPYPFGYIFGSDSYDGGVSTTQKYDGYYPSTYYIPSSLKSVTITDCKNIPYGAFYNCTGLTSVTIPNSVTSIGADAFRGCTGLTSVTIPNSVISIERYAFLGCTGLKSVTILNNVKSIGEKAFYDCTGLTSVTIPDSVTSIEEEAFYNTAYYNNPSNWENNVLYIGNHLIKAKDSISGSYAIKSGTKCVADCAFYECTGLTSVTIPNSVTSIGDKAFSFCTGLTEVTIPDSVTSIGSSPFYCTAYYNNSSNWENNVLYIGNHLIDAKTSISGSYTIKSGTKCIAVWAFCDCEGLTEVTIPNSVTSIGDKAFYDCEGLTEVTIGNSVTSIEYATFEGCTCLKSVTIPNSVTSIGDDAFYRCTDLTSVNIPSSVTYIGEKAFGYYYDFGYGSKKVSDFTIYGVKGSAAEKYADNEGFAFIPVEENSPDTPNPSACKYCGQVHEGFAGLIVSFFHSILYIFKNMF